MSKTNLANAAKNLKGMLTKHSPEILTGVGIAGMVTTTILAVKATPKAVKILESHKEENEKITPVDAIKLTWKGYIPAIVTGSVSIACLIGASSANLKRNAALATAYKLSETALSEYKESVVEAIGEKKEKHVQEKVAEKQVKKNPVSDKEIVITGDGKSLCYDPLSDRYFMSSMDILQKAENKLNKEMIQSVYGYASINDFYEEIGLPRTEVGNLLGWNSEHTIELHVTATPTEDGRPALVVGHYNRPIYNYDR